MNDDQPKNKVPIKALLLGILAATAFVIAFWQAPWWFDSLHIRKTKLEPADGVIITGVRTGLVAFAAGVIAGVGLYYTHKKHNLEQLQFAHARQQFAESQQQFATTLQESQERDTRQAELAREGQVTGRYVEAVKLLGSDNLHQRLGGIYALERVMNDSDRDHRTIVEVLSAFVRTSLQAAVTMQEPQHPNSSSAQPKATSADGLFILSEDTKAALTVLGRRDAGEGTAVSAELAGVQLARYDLVEAKWPRLQLARASLADANLRSADLNGVRLDNADLNELS
ncbi:pentapeptide repeat-containing protein [Streptomyces tauricus]|uniref:pentapeptide repeat-containing protein n=1 Tax=Streptomyces tauricus TaxID=68274 RepID=UPI0033A2305C